MANPFVANAPKPASPRGMYPTSGVAQGGQQGRMSLVTRPGGRSTATNVHGSMHRHHKKRPFVAQRSAQMRGC